MKPAQNAGGGGLDPAEYEDALDLTRRARRYFGGRLDKRMSGGHDVEITIKIAQVYGELLDREIMLDELRASGQVKPRHRLSGK